MTNTRGFTLVELITALVLFGIVGTALYQLLVNNQRLYRQQTEQVGVNQAARAGAALLPLELRELNAGDPVGSDIIAMAANEMTYKAMRNLYVLCQPPDVANLQLVVSPSSYYGLRPLDVSRDSLLVFAEGDSTTRADDQWVHADVTFMESGNDCPGGTASLTITTAGVSVLDLLLGAVQNGAPVRGFEVARLQLYQQDGEYWLGGQIYQKALGSWGPLQPIVGPMTDAGLALAYYDAAGNTATAAADVARIGITVASRSNIPIRGEYLVEDLVTTVALRNNPTY